MIYEKRAHLAEIELGKDLVLETLISSSASQKQGINFCFWENIYDLGRSSLFF